MRTIIVAVDGSEPSMHAVKLAGDLAQAMQAEVHLVYAIPPVVMPMEVNGYAVGEMMERHYAYGETLLAETKQKLPKQLTVTTEVCNGTPAEQITEIAKEKDAAMVVIGNTGRGAAGRLLMGSTADRVVHLCPRPVLVVR